MTERRGFILGSSVLRGRRAGRWSIRALEAAAPADEEAEAEHQRGYREDGAVKPDQVLLLGVLDLDVLVAGDGAGVALLAAEPADGVDEENDVRIVGQIEVGDDVG